MHIHLDLARVVSRESRDSAFNTARTQLQRQLAAVPLLVWLVTVVTPPAQALAAGSRFYQLGASRPLRLRPVVIRS
jgi:hypothetical protein